MTKTVHPEQRVHGSQRFLDVLETSIFRVRSVVFFDFVGSGFLSQIIEKLFDWSISSPIVAELASSPQVVQSVLAVFGFWLKVFHCSEHVLLLRYFDPCQFPPKKHELATVVALSILLDIHPKQPLLTWTNLLAPTIKKFFRMWEHPEFFFR